MPSRPITAIIVLFWIGTLGWFGYRDLWPKFRPGDAPPFVIDLADEVIVESPRQIIHQADALWLIYRGDKQIGTAKTFLRYRKEDDTHELETRVTNFVLMDKIIFMPRSSLVIPEMTSSYRLNRAGELRGIVVTGKLVLEELKDGKPTVVFEADASFQAAVRDDLMYWTGNIAIKDVGTVEPTIEPVPAPRGIFLNPMHPMYRIRGLRPGRRWQMPVVDPLAEIVGPVFQALQEKFRPRSNPIVLKLPTGPKFLSAEVLSETAPAIWNNQEFECFVLEFRGDNNETFRTFVRKSDGQVLRQEAQAPGGRFVIQRQ